MSKPATIDLAAIRAAARRIQGVAVKTPVHRSAAVDRETGAAVLFKCELFQPTGAFKLRGAANAVFSLEEDAARNGVVTHSSGNHGAALAYAARERGIRCVVVMPENAISAKVDAVRRYGATVVFCEATQQGREQTLDAVVAGGLSTASWPARVPVPLSCSPRCRLWTRSSRPSAAAA